MVPLPPSSLLILGRGDCVQHQGTRGGVNYNSVLPPRSFSFVCACLNDSAQFTRFRGASNGSSHHINSTRYQNEQQCETAPSHLSATVARVLSGMPQQSRDTSCTPQLAALLHIKQASFVPSAPEAQLYPRRHGPHPGRG